MKDSQSSLNRVGRALVSKRRQALAVTLTGAAAVAVSAPLLVGNSTAGAADVDERRPPPPPGPPAWVDSDGLVDLSRLPDGVPLGDANGEIMGYADPLTFGGEFPPTAPDVVPSPQPARDMNGNVLPGELVITDDGVQVFVRDYAPGVGEPGS